VSFCLCFGMRMGVKTCVTFVVSHFSISCPFPTPPSPFSVCSELSECTTGVDAAEEELGRSDSTISRLRGAATDKERQNDLARVELLKEAVRALTMQTKKLGAPRKRASVVPTIREVDEVTLAEASVHAGDEDGESDEALGIDAEAATGGQTAAQTAAVELLAAERDLLSEELTALAAKTGVSADIGPLPADVAQDAAEKADEEEEAAPAPPTPAVASKAGSSSAPPSPSSAAPVSAPAAAPEDADAGSAADASSLLASFASSSSSAVAADAGASSLLDAFGASSAVGSSSAAVPEASSLDFGGLSFVGGGASDAAAAATEEETTAAAAEEAAPAPAAEDPAVAAAARLEELKTIALAVASSRAAVQEKTSVIEDAVSREDFDTAGEL
jgi:hypothetical protein